MPNSTIPPVGGISSGHQSSFITWRWEPFCWPADNTVQCWLEYIKAIVRKIVSYLSAFLHPSPIRYTDSCDKALEYQWDMVKSCRRNLNRYVRWHSIWINFAPSIVPFYRKFTVVFGRLVSTNTNYNKFVKLNDSCFVTDYIWIEYHIISLCCV